MAIGFDDPAVERPGKVNGNMQNFSRNLPRTSGPFPALSAYPKRTENREKSFFISG